MQLRDERETHFGTSGTTAQAGASPKWAGGGIAVGEGWGGEGEIRWEREGLEGVDWWE